MNNPAITIPSSVIHSGRGVYVVFLAIGDDVGTGVDTVVDELVAITGSVVSIGRVLTGVARGVASLPKVIEFV
jgi:hypothetical protein